MQDNRISTTNRPSNGRKTTNTANVTVRKVAAVKKGSKKSVKRASNLRAVRAPKVFDVKKQNKAPFPWSVVVVAVLFTGLFLFMMMNYAEVDKYNSEIAALDTKIASLEKTQDDLEVTLGDKYDLREIEEYAKNELGMTDTVPQENIHYITNEQGDRTEMYNYEEGEEGGFGFLLTGFGEILRDYFGD